MSDTPLSQLAQVVRSKNAGPTLLTIDVFFNDAQAYARRSGIAKHSGGILHIDESQRRIIFVMA